MAAQRYELFSSSVEKYFTRLLRSLVTFFSTREEPCNVLFII